MKGKGRRHGRTRGTFFLLLQHVRCAVQLDTNVALLVLATKSSHGNKNAYVRWNTGGTFFCSNEFKRHCGPTFGKRRMERPPPPPPKPSSSLEGGRRHGSVARSGVVRAAMERRRLLGIGTAFNETANPKRAVVKMGTGNKSIPLTS